MKNRALLSLFATALAIAGCAHHRPGPWGGPGAVTHKDCGNNGHKCEVVVTVTDCTPAGIHVDFEELGVVRGTPAVDIEWTLDSSGYQFAGSDGIAFKGTAWRQQFSNIPTGNKDKYKFKDKNSPGSGKFPYSITIEKSDGSACASRDPIIINDV